MSQATTPSNVKHDLTESVESLVFTAGISKKTGNPYIVGQVKIKSPIGAFAIDLEYLNDNAQNVVRALIEQKDNKAKSEFAEGIQE